MPCTMLLDQGARRRREGIVREAKPRSISLPRVERADSRSARLLDGVAVAESSRATTKVIDLARVPAAERTKPRRARPAGRRAPGPAARVVAGVDRHICSTSWSAAGRPHGAADRRAPGRRRLGERAARRRRRHQSAERGRPHDAAAHRDRSTATSTSRSSLLDHGADPERSAARTA